MSKVYLLPNLRKGLAKHITTPKSTEKDPHPIRASFEVKASLLGTKVDAKEKDPETPIQEKRELPLAGPVDVRTVNAAAISEVVPADNSVGYSFGYMPYIEFYEEDFPWRYTPQTGTDKLRPWLMLLACKDDEFTLTKDNKGFRRVTVNTNECEDFYPPTAKFHQLAHVQVTVPEWMNLEDAEGKVDSEKVADYVVQNPDDGISRLFCYRKLEEKTHYTMFLVPAFELGRRAGMGESLDGAGITDLSWTDQSKALSFPVYYQWSFKTGSETFLGLAKKQNFISDEEFKALPDGLKLDVQETGLRAYREFTSTMDEDKVLVDMPAALVKRGFDESKLADVPQPVPTLTLDGVSMMAELHGLLELSPVFSQNEGLKETEDPWVVPPVYGARHVLAETTDLDRGDLFLNKLNLRFRNRAAAGLGVSVVKRNQETFVNRAWGMIDTINAANQQIREYYEAVKANGAASKKATSLRYFQFKPYASGLQADAAIRVANAQSAANVNAVDLAMDLAADPAVSQLSVRSSVFQPLVKASGISRDELDVISNRDYWELHWADIVRKSNGYQFLTGKKSAHSKQDPYYDGGIDERFDFLRPILQIKYPTSGIDLTQEETTIKPVFDEEGKVLHFKSDNIEYSLPARSIFLGIKDFMEVVTWLHDETSAAFGDEHLWYNPWLSSMLSMLKTAEEEEYEGRWNKIQGDGSKLHMRCLPVRTQVYEGDKDNVVGYAFFMMKEAYEPFLANYPNGFFLKFDDKGKGDKKLFILPQEKFNDVQEASVGWDGSKDFIPLVRDQEKEGRFMPESAELTMGTMALFIDYKRQCGIYTARNHMVKESYYYKILSTLVEQYAGSNQVLFAARKGETTFYKGSKSVGEVYRLYFDLEGQDSLVVKGDFVYDKKKKWYGKKTWYHIHLGFCIPMSDECIIYKDEKLVGVQMSKLMPRVIELKDRLDWVDDIMWSPNCARLKVSSLKSVPEVTADFIGKIDEKIEDMNKLFEAVCNEADNFRKLLQDANIIPVTDEVAFSEDLDEEFKKEELIDADEENRKRLVELANTFAERGMSLDLSVSNFDGKYPIMAYPIFPDPTSFYLRELSERFILPSVDKLKLNSISCFVTNPIFEEAFLAGMNTEMGRELLWREYPTDERGSYFRKFWDQVELPSDFSNGYFDVKYLHNWNKRLGANHEDGKGQLVVFIIKSELMMMYPQTGITLSIPKNGVLDNVLAPTMTGWLADDTYMAGFDISKLSTTEGLYLTFTETDKSQRFTCLPRDGENYPDLAGDLSTQFAVKHKIDGTVWGHQVDKGYLVVNDLHLDDDDDDGSGNLAGNGSGIHVVPKPNQDLNLRQELDKDIRPELKR